MPDVDQPKESLMLPEFNSLIDEARESSLRAYGERPGWIEGHYGIEQMVVGGGYEYRQVLELVQNAADAILEFAQSENERKRRIAVVLRGNCLYAANTGAPVSKDGIEALLDSHRSSKRQNQIGRFGLGFKSLLKLGGKIDVCSRTVAFTFDPARCRTELRQRFSGRFDERKTPGLRLAWPMAEEEAVELKKVFPWATTVIRAEILEDDVVSKLREKLAEFPSKFLLFLPVSVKLILDCAIGGERLLHCEREGDDAVLYDADTSARWRIKDEVVSVDDINALNDATDIHARSEVPVSWAIPLDRKRDEAGRFWAFFPTETPTFLPGILNAPWKVDPARDGIIAGEWNNGLMCKAAQLIARHLPSLSTSDDPSRHLDYFPRQPDGGSVVAAPLVEAVWEAVKQAPIVPDATLRGELQKGCELWRHPIEKPELAAEWAELASPEQRAQMVHSSCYQSVDRASRLRALADHLKPQPVSEDQRPNLRCRDFKDWFRDVRSAEPNVAMKVLRLAENYSLACPNQQEWDRVRSSLAIIPSVNGDLLTPGQLYLAPSGEDIPGLSLVAPFLTQEEEGRRLVVEVMKVRGLDDQRWRSLLTQAFGTIGMLGDPEFEWSDFWSKLRSAPAFVRDAFLAEKKAKVRVRRRDGRWVLSDEALLPGRIVCDGETDEANIRMLIDLDSHRNDEAILSRIGVSDIPHGSNGPGSWDEILKENGETFSEWMNDCRREYRVHGDRGPRPRTRFLGAFNVEMPKGWSLLTHLVGRANTVLTVSLIERLSGSNFASPLEFGHSSTPNIYRKIEVPHPLLWLLCKHGRIMISDAAVRIAALVQSGNEPALALIPGWDRYAAAMPLLAQARPCESASDGDKQALWAALIKLRATPEALDSDDLHDLWAAAGRSGVIPPTLPWRGATVSRAEVFVTESSELARRARTGGRLAVRLDMETMGKWIEAGAQKLDGLLRPRFDAAAPTAPLVTVFPEFGAILRDDPPEGTICQAVSNLELCLDDDAEPIACLFWNEVLLADREQLTRKPRLEMLKLLIAELGGAGWLSMGPEAAIRELWDGQVEARRQQVRERLTLPERLFEAVGCHRERLLEVLGGLRGKPFLENLSGEQLAEVVLTLFGTATLSKLRDALEDNGLKPPGRWSSAEARAFVESIGFGSEFAVSPTSRRDEEEFISGPIHLPDLHDYQDDVYQGLKGILSLGSGRRRGVVCLPTGAGKTRVVVQASVELVLNQEGDNRTVLWVAQTDELCEQAVQAFRQVWINRGSPSTDLRICRLWGGNPNPRRPESEVATVVVTSIQTLSGRVGSMDLDWLTVPRMMIVDECHRAITKSYTTVLKWLGVLTPATDEARRDEPAIIGLSATPFRGTDVEATQRLANRFDNRLLPQQQDSLYKKLRADGVLACEDYEPIDFHSVLSPDLKGRLEEWERRITDEEVPEGIETDNLLDEINQSLAPNEIRNEELLRCLEKHIADNEHASILFFANTVLHAEEMAARLFLRGIPAAAISSDTPATARRDFLDKFKSGKIKVLCNYLVLTTGFDSPRTDMILISRKVFSPVAYMQMVGRGLRGPLNGGTERCRIMTVVDNLGRFDTRRHFEYFQEHYSAPEGP